MIETLPAIFKRTSAGKVQIWYREIEGDRYRSVTGQIEGKKTASDWTTAKPKSVGRSNATTGEEQARLECEAEYKKKLAQGGYHESIDDIDKPKFFKPMAANKWGDKPRIVSEDSPVYSQPKLDGVRCIANREGLWSRQGKPIESCPHVVKALVGFFESFPLAVLDGELYGDNLSDNFNEIISLVRKQKAGPSHFGLTEQHIQYHVYDAPGFSGTFEERWDLVEMCSTLHLHPEAIRIVETIRVTNVDDLDALYSSYLERGYEGQMVRSASGLYKQKRCDELLKRKEFFDEEFEIIDIVEGNGNRAGMAGRITYRNDNGDVFGSGIKGGEKFYTEIFNDREDYIGGEGTVRYQCLTPDGIPKFPVTVAVYRGERDV